MTRFALAVGVMIAAVPAWADDPPKAKGPAGLWLGVLKVGPIDLRLAFDITDKDGKLSAKWYSLDQTKDALPVRGAKVEDGKLALDLGVAKFSGTLAQGGDTLAGTFEQGGQAFPLKLERIEKLPEVKRPQTPKAPFPYPAEDVEVPNEAANIKLAGTLTLPKGDGPFPAVVLVTGSGPHDRDETLFEHKPFLVIADHLARHGIACLRCDDRGVGKSGGTFAGSTSADFATDAFAGVSFLKGRKRIDPKRVGVVGHSEGGVIAPLVASEHPADVAFIVLLAGPGVSGEKVLYQQALDFSKLADPNTTEAEVKEFVEAVTPVLREKTPTKEAAEKLTAALTKLAETGKDVKKRAAAVKAMPAVAARLADPWMRWFVLHDPAPVLKKVTCPVLALNGEKDAQVKAKDNLAAIEEALTAGGNKRFKCVELKGLNHLFQPCKTGLISEYGLIEETFAPDALTLMSEWIAERK